MSVFQTSAVHSLYKLHAQLSKLMQNYEGPWFFVVTPVVTPFFTGARHGSLCLLLVGKQSANTAPFLCRRKGYSLTNRISQSAENSLCFERERSVMQINHVGKKQTRVRWHKAMSGFDKSAIWYNTHWTAFCAYQPVSDQRIHNTSEAKGELPKMWSVFNLQGFFHWDLRYRSKLLVGGFFFPVKSTEKCIVSIESINYLLEDFGPFQALFYFCKCIRLIKKCQRNRTVHFNLLLCTSY